MNSLTGSITDSIRLYAEFSNYDSIQTKPLLKKGKTPISCDKIISIKDNEIIPNRIIKRQLQIENYSKVPPDKYYIAALVAFFSGVTGVLPLEFFFIANDYWMYKFRDTAQPHYDLNNKTDLQKTFVSRVSICTSFPSLISVILTARYGHKMDLRNRLLLSLNFVSIMFLLFTIFVVVNTDRWQTIFFSITMTLFGISSFFTPFYSMTNVAYLSKFPTFYMELNILGTAVSGLFSTILQIISLAVGHTSTQIAMIYFCSGSVIVIFTLFLIYITKYSATIQYYLQNRKEESNKHIYTMKEYWEVAKKIWFILLITVINMCTDNMGHNNITNLVVSEGYTGTGQSLWHDKYFVVVATYLLFDIFQIFGILFGRPVLKEKTAIYFILLALFKSFGLTPLLWFCNAQPRNHLPVLFAHDYQYMIIAAINSFTGSIFTAISFLSIPGVAKDKTEQAHILMIGVITISLTVTSPLSPVYVNLL